MGSRSGQQLVGRVIRGKTHLNLSMGGKGPGGLSEFRNLHHPYDGE